MKRCSKCDVVKPLSEFYRHAQMADGHLNKCKECTQKDMLQHRSDNLAAVQAYDRERGQLPHRKAAVRARAHRYKDQDAKRNTKYRGQQPRQARIAVGNAVRDGKLLVPETCEKCPSTGPLNAHHEDYSKPLYVNWLCDTCHGARHREINEAKRLGEASMPSLNDNLPEYDEPFDDWCHELSEKVIQGEYGYEPGEFTVFPAFWRKLYEQGLTPLQAWQRTLAEMNTA